MTNFEIPKSGSEWLYLGHRVVVDQVYVQYHYKDSSDKHYKGTLRLFQPGNVFTPAPVDPKPGETYRSDRYVFHVYEVVDSDVFGRVAQLDALDTDDWYPVSYSLKRFRNDFKKVDDGTTFN